MTIRKILFQLFLGSLLLVPTPALAQDTLTHVFFANQSRLPLTLVPELSGNTANVSAGKLSYRAHEITHDHVSTLSPGDLIGLPEKDHNEANSFLRCKRTTTGNNNDYFVEISVRHAGNELFTLVITSRDSTATGFSRLYYNIRFQNGSWQDPPPGKLLRDDRNGQVQEANEFEYEGNFYRLVYGVFNEHQDNTDNIIFSLSNKTDTIYRYDPPLADTADPTVLHVMSYNTAFLMPLFISDQDENEKVKVFHKVIPKNLDVLVLQECFEPPLVNRVLADLSPYYPYQTGRHNKVLVPGVGKDGGVRILSKYPILEDSEVSFSENGCIPEDIWSKFANKGVKYVKINKQGQIIHVFGTHTSEQPCDIYVMGRFMAGFDIPKEDIVIMAGDFNVDLNRLDEDNGEDDYSIMLDTLNALEPTFLSFLNDWEYKGTTSGLNHYYCCNPDGKQHLDYVLVSSRGKIPYLLTNRSLQGRLNEVDESFGIFDMSDHEPVYARIEFPALFASASSFLNCLGDVVTLKADLLKPAPGGHFQWYKGDELLLGENAAELRVTLDDPSDFSAYSCRYRYDYLPDTAINNFFDLGYMNYHWIFRGTTTGELSLTFTIAPQDSSELCYGVPTLVPLNTLHTPFSVFPNPADQYIDIHGTDLGDYSMEVVDILERLVQPLSVQATGGTVRVYIRHLAPGTYFIKGTREDKNYVAPFIKL